MKFYNLTYDCNQPTAQQVNIPTNTDYKLGVKVKRNGEMQNLSPNSVKLYTGKTITVEPTDYNADRALADSTASLLIALTPATISAELGGKTINTVVPEVSYDNGATWGEVYATEVFDQYFLVMDKSQGNYYYARLNLKNPNSKWELLDGTTTGVVGTADTITMPTNPQAFLNSNPTNWSIASYPCVFRLVIKYGGYSYPVYIQPDAEKTNGYVTFTLSSDDNASYTNQKIDIEKGYDAEFYNHNEIVNTSGAATYVMGLSADMSEYAGITIKPNDVLLYAKQATGTTPPTEEEMFLSATTYWDLPENFAPLMYKSFIVDASGTAKVHTYVNGAAKTELLETLGWPADKPGFIITDPNDPTKYAIAETYTFADGDKLTVAPNWRMLNNRNLAVLCKFTAGTPFSANFKLNTNIFKSQQGDIGELGRRANTVSIAGTLSDSTPFDYNVVIK